MIGAFYLAQQRAKIAKKRRRRNFALEQNSPEHRHREMGFPDTRRSAEQKPRLCVGKSIRPTLRDFCRPHEARLQSVEGTATASRVERALSIPRGDTGLRHRRLVAIPDPTGAADDRVDAVALDAPPGSAGALGAVDVLAQESFFTRSCGGRRTRAFWTRSFQPSSCRPISR